MRKPNLFIVGEPKAGTTALYFFLKQHPDIFMTEMKEPRYFCTDYHKEFDSYNKKNNAFPIRDEKEYLKLFSDWKNEKYAGESSASYANSKVAIKNISEFNPDAKLIIMIREPVSFLRSFHYHLNLLKWEDVKDLKTALTLEKSRKSGKNLPKHPYALSYYLYSEWICYTDHITRCYKYFDKKQVKIIIYDDFKEDNQKIIKEVFRFLDVDSNFKPSIKLHNVGRKTRFPMLSFIEAPVFWKIPKKILSEKSYDKIKGVYFEYGKKPPMDKKFKKELMKRFRPEILKLSKLLDRNLIELWGY